MKDKYLRFRQKVEAFIDIALSLKSLSVSQTNKVSCIIFKKDFSEIASIGYNGRYPGCPINPLTGGEEISLEPGMSGFVHAEVNAAIKFSRPQSEIKDYVVLCTLSPCLNCAQVIVNKGFKYV